MNVKWKLNIFKNKSENDALLYLVISLLLLRKLFSWNFALQCTF